MSQNLEIFYLYHLKQPGKHELCTNINIGQCSHLTFEIQYLMLSIVWLNEQSMSQSLFGKPACLVKFDFKKRKKSSRSYIKH